MTARYQPGLIAAAHVTEAQLRTAGVIGPGTDRVEALWSLACVRGRLAGWLLADDWMGYAVRCLAPAFRGADMGHLMTLGGVAGFQPGGASWQCARCERRASAPSGQLGEPWGSALYEVCDVQIAAPSLAMLLRVQAALAGLA